MRVAALQMCSSPDPVANLLKADALVRRAAADGARLVLLPEKWTALGHPEDIAAGAQPLDGPAITWARALAAELGIDLVAGSFAESVPGRERTSNTSVHVGPGGELHAVYRKLHLFDVTVDGTRYEESAREQPGEEMVVSRTADGVGLGLSVCYDLRFPELYRALAVAGARILLVPSAFTWATTLQHWEVLLRARAIEEQCFVIAANQHSEAVPGLRTGGHSMIVDPWGVVLAQAPADGDAVVLADLDAARQDHIRATLPSLQHLRPEAYARPATGGT